MRRTTQHILADVSLMWVARSFLTCHPTHAMLRHIGSRYSPLSSLERVLVMFSTDAPSPAYAAVMLEALDECEAQRQQSVGGGGSGGGGTSHGAAKGDLVSKVRQRLEGLLGGQLHP